MGAWVPRSELSTSAHAELRMLPGDAAALGGQGGFRVVGVIKADNQAGVLGAVEGDLQSARLPAVHSGEQQLAHGPVEEGAVREPARPVPTENLEVARLQPLDSADRPVDDVNALHRRERDADVAMHRQDALAGRQLEDDLVALAHNVRHGQPPDSGGANNSPTAPEGD